MGTMMVDMVEKKNSLFSAMTAGLATMLQEVRKCVKCRTRECEHFGPEEDCILVITDTEGNPTIDEETGKETRLPGIVRHCLKCKRDVGRMK